MGFGCCWSDVSGVFWEKGKNLSIGLRVCLGLDCVEWGKFEWLGRNVCFGREWGRGRGLRGVCVSGESSCVCGVWCCCLVLFGFIYIF